MALGRWQGRARLALGLLFVAVNLVLLNVLASRHHLRSDWTESRLHALSPRTVEEVRRIHRPVKLVMVMVPPERLRGASLMRQTRELLRRIARHSSLVAVEHVDPELNPTRTALLTRQYNLNRRDLGQGGVVVASGKRSTFVAAAAMAELTLTAGVERVESYKGEAALLGALLRVTAREQDTVCFTRGHSEGAIDSYAESGYGHIADDIRRDGFRVRTLDGGERQADLKPCRVVVVAGPRTAFAAPELDTLDRYLRQGGRMLVLFGPVLDRRASRHLHVGLEPLLATWGIQVLDNIVLDRVGVPGEQPLVTWATRDGYGAHPVARAMHGRVTVWPMVREVRPGTARRRGVTVEALVRTSSSGWAETDLASVRGERPLRLDRSVDTPGPVSVAVAAWSDASRLVVIGTDHGVLNRRLGRLEVRDYNRDLFLASLGWLAGSESRVAVGPKVVERLRLTLDQGQLARVFLITVVGLPLFSALIGVLVWWRRRR